MRSRIRGVASYMRTFSFLYGASLAHCILKHSDNLSKALQGNVSAVKGQKMAAATVVALESLRDDSNFSLFWEKEKIRTKQLAVPEIPRKTRPPKRIDDGAQPYEPKTVEEYYRAIYFEAVDLITNCIKDRFAQPAVLQSKVGSVLNTALIGGEFTSDLDDVIRFYGKDLNHSTLETQLHTLSINFPKDKKTKIIGINDIIDFVKDTGQSLFSEVVTLLLLLQVMPANNSTS